MKLITYVFYHGSFELKSLFVNVLYNPITKRYEVTIRYDGLLQHKDYGTKYFDHEPEPHEFEDWVKRKTRRFIKKFVKIEKNEFIWPPIGDDFLKWNPGWKFNPEKIKYEKIDENL